MSDAQNEAPKAAGSPMASALSRIASPERLLRALFDDAPYGVFITRTDGRVASCNAFITRLLGYSPEQIIDHHFNEFTHPEDLSIGPEIIRSLLVGEQSHVSLEKRYVHANGTILWVQLGVGVIRNEQGAVDYFVTIFDDVSEERRQQQALAESEQRVKRLLEAIPYRLLCVNVDGVCVYYKPAREDRNDSSDVFVGKRLHDVVSHDEAQTLLDTVRAVLSTNQAFNVDYQVSTAEGERHYEAHVAPYMANEAIVLVLDITARIESERNQMQAQAAIISGQRDVLRQISTPLLPIAEGIVAMPLVGPVDRERAQQMLTTLMDGVTSHAAHTVIIDIAGVPNVDIEVAELLARVTQVVKLLGAEALFAGVRPDVARNIIALGIDLTTFRSAGSFQSAIATALRRNRLG